MCLPALVPMVACRRMLTLVPFLSLLHCSAAAVAAPLPSAVMRRQVHLGPEGELTQIKHKSVSICDDDFPLGHEGTNDCAEHDHKPIDEGILCQEAGESMNVSANHPTFLISSEWFDSHPAGCFVYRCTEDPKGICVFYNAVGYVQDSNAVLHGRPVCSRPKVREGTPNSNDCPTGYQLIEDEEDCKSTDECLNIIAGDPFRKHENTQSEFNKFPKGCLIDSHLSTATAKTAFYNPPYHEDPEKMPSEPVGVPLCNVSEITFFKTKVADDYFSGEHVLTTTASP